MSVHLLLLMFWHLCASIAMSMPSETNCLHILKGSCACGSIQYQVQDVTTTTTPIVDCHCPQCRKHHIAAFSTFLVTPTESVTIHDDGDIETVQDSCSELGNVERLFCKRCYSKVATRPLCNDDDDTSLLLCLGSIDDESIPESLCEVWKKNRIQWQERSAANWPKARARLTRHGLMQPSPPPTLRVTGSCSCGACSYELTEPPTELQHCYCKLCRQLSGSAFQTWVPVFCENFVWTGRCGEPDLVRTTSHGQRHVCTRCGGVLTIVYDADPDCVWPAAGGLDDATLPDSESDMGRYLHRVVHICCVWKQPWYQLPDDGLKRIDYACE